MWFPGKIRLAYKLILSHASQDCKPVSSPSSNNSDKPQKALLNFWVNLLHCYLQGVWNLPGSVGLEHKKSANRNPTISCSRLPGSLCHTSSVYMEKSPDGAVCYASTNRSLEGLQKGAWEPCSRKKWHNTDPFGADYKIQYRRFMGVWDASSLALQVNVD